MLFEVNSKYIMYLTTKKNYYSLLFTFVKFNSININQTNYVQFNN